MTPAELRSIRVRMRMSQDELGIRLGVHQTAVSEYERGASPVPADIAATIRRLDSTGVRGHRRWPLWERFGVAKVRSVLLECEWNTLLAAKRLQATRGSVYACIYKHLGEEWRRRYGDRSHLQDPAFLRKAFKAHDWNITAAARSLRLERTVLREIARHVIPEEMKRNVRRRRGRLAA
jgi:transcriptional regulator with XRE-family HTH domain